MVKASKFGDAISSILKRGAKTSVKGADDAAQSLARGVEKNAAARANVLKRMGKDGTDAAETAAETASKKRTRSYVDRCKGNPTACMAAGGATALAGYTLVQWPKASADQATCMTECLPANWDTDPAAPAYRKEKATRTQPRCTGGDCSQYCRERCEFEQTTMSGHVAKGARDAVESFAVNVLGIDPSTLRRILLAVAGYFVVRLVVWPVYELFFEDDEGTNVNVQIKETSTPSGVVLPQMPRQAVSGQIPMQTVSGQIPMQTAPPPPQTAP